MSRDHSKWGDGKKHAALWLPIRHQMIDIHTFGRPSHIRLYIYLLFVGSNTLPLQARQLIAARV